MVAKKKAGKKAAAHPPFAAMIANALKDCKGFQKMSRQAIAKSISSNYKGTSNTKALGRALKSGVAKGTLIVLHETSVDMQPWETAAAINSATGKIFWQITAEKNAS